MAMGCNDDGSCLPLGCAFLVIVVCLVWMLCSWVKYLDKLKDAEQSNAVKMLVAYDNRCTPLSGG